MQARLTLATMAKIIDKIRETLARGDVVTSFEFFPAKTEQVNVKGHRIYPLLFPPLATRTHMPRLDQMVDPCVVPARTEQA